MRRSVLAEIVPQIVKAIVKYPWSCLDYTTTVYPDVCPEEAWSNEQYMYWLAAGNTVFKNFHSF